MKKRSLLLGILGFLVVSAAVPAYSWQGRMAGMGDPYGLLEDESDFLIHPAGIAKGQGIAYYGHYRFTWWDVKDWDYTTTIFDPTTGRLIETMPYRGSGDEQQHDGLLGAAFPLGSGRMGLFFEYLSKRGDFDGDEDNQDFFWDTSYYHLYQLENDLDSFALRLLYGFPMGGFKLGGETQLAYRREKNQTFMIEDSLGTPAFYTNSPFGYEEPDANLFPFMFPYNSKYWEALFKGSLSGGVGAGEFAFTTRGGFIFAGDNKLEHSYGYLTSSGNIDMDGDINGWRVGGDLWLRSPLAEGLSLPMVLKVDYWEKTRDGDAMGTGVYAGDSFDYENRKRMFQVEAGGGLDKELNKGAKIAAGIYYGYIENKNDFVFNDLEPGSFWSVDYSKYPDSREHRVILRLAGEKELSPQITMGMGLNCFYGWVKEDFNFNVTSSGFPGSIISDASLDGHHWGIGASLGGTVKFNRFSLEPFIGGGYENLNLDGDGIFYDDFPVEWDKTRKEWFIGGGFSINF